ncbi:hypothetical protein DL93DRAFT_2070644 [Clavulina sp. PMI_390]|nr:hypothetical protein DL93DRAFT_2070644 [Clavulina sp. PMI_390]
MAGRSRSNPQPKPSSPSPSCECHCPHNQSKTLILCFDGTKDRYNDKISNIARLVSLFEKNDPDRQLVYYQAGIGTSIGPAYLGRAVQYVEDIWDAAFATSLSQHVMGGYTFLMNHWREGDRICLFGFSRGAYIARALNGMLYHVGLLPPSMLEEVRFAYSIYTKQMVSAQYKHDFSRNVSVEFIGVFDTVESVGIMLPRTLPFPGNNHMVKTFRHALSLDEHRAAYQAEPWQRSLANVDPVDNLRMRGKKRTGMLRSLFGGAKDEVKLETQLTLHEEQDPSAGPIPTGKGTDCKEVYFAGCHADIGGGSVPSHTKWALENIPFRWMIKEILEAQPGIIFRDDPRLAEMGIYIDPEVRRQDSTSSSTTRTPAVGSPERPEDPSARTYSAEPGGPEGKAAVVLGPDPPEPDDSPSPYMPVDARHQDVTAKMNDELASNPFWIPLEFLPFVTSYQDEDDVWHNRIRFNLFRGRRIQPPPSPSNPNSQSSPDPRGANISSAPALFHISVKQRMEADLEVSADGKGKKKKYKPRARLMSSGEPVFVR